jgi:hypothetical protein
MTLRVNPDSGPQWKSDYRTECGNTVGKMVYDFDNGDIAKITVNNPDAPELPNMEFIEFIGWSYHTTEFHQTTRDKVTYYFFVGDFDEDELRQVVFLFDTLYGF